MYCNEFSRTIFKQPEVIMRKLCIISMIGMMLLISAANHAIAVTLVAQSDSWDYAVMSTDLWSNWGSAGYSSFDWENASWTAGQAAFGNGEQTITYWSANKDLALSKTITINGLVTGNATLNVGVDNGFIVFVNGKQVAKANAEGSWDIWEYTYSISSTYFINGQNIIRAFAEDHGGGTFFDMMLTAEVNPVPIPGALWLLGSGLMGLIGIRRRFAK
jgi:hypothetical protein